MGRTYLVAVMMLGALASLLSSGTSEPQAVTGGDARPDSGYFYESRSRNSDAAVSGSSSDQAIELDRDWDGHFYADVQVNGQSIRFLVDTGASGIALSRDDARLAGLATSISMPQVVGQGASGEVHGEIVMLDRISLGPEEAEDVPAVVLDAGSQSLLGQSFLGKFDKVEIRGDRMILQ